MRPATGLVGVSVPQTPRPNRTPHRTPRASSTPVAAKAALTLEEARLMRGTGGEDDVALARHANEGMRSDLKDANRMYNAEAQKGWEKKYAFFSGSHMRGNYRTFARARHDPFNKDPSWGQSILQKIGRECAKKGTSVEKVFQAADVSGDGILNRAEVKKALLSNIPTLSDMELAAIFNIVDENNDNEVSSTEFVGTVSKACAGKPISSEANHAWRNPVHRVRRFYPANAEVRTHLEGSAAFNKETDLVDSLAGEMAERLSPQTSRSREPSLVQSLPKYHFFNGGADADRFMRKDWVRGRSANTAGSSVPDPGPDVKPGWHHSLSLRASGAMTAR